jgi:hypothetical protein
MATKKIVEKKTGEKYASKTAMAKHEKKESKAEQMKEYGKVKSPMKQVGTPRPAAKARPTAAKVDSPAMMKKVTKKTAYDIKEASNQKLTAGARKHYAENAQAAMKNKPVAKMKKC